jgi:hypothetical protein
MQLPAQILEPLWVPLNSVGWKVSHLLKFAVMAHAPVAHFSVMLWPDLTQPSLAAINLNPSVESKALKKTGLALQFLIVTEPAAAGRAEAHITTHASINADTTAASDLVNFPSLADKPC